MARKGKLENKAIKKPVQNKKETSKEIDWDSLPNTVTIVGIVDKHLNIGQEYTISKGTAKLLVEKGSAKLK